MAFLYKILSVSEEVSLSPADQPVDPMLWSLLMVGAFAAVLVVMVAFLKIVRKNKDPYR